MPRSKPSERQEFPCSPGSSIRIGNRYSKFHPTPCSPTYAKTTIPHTLHDHCIPASAKPCHATPCLAMVRHLMSWVRTIPASFCVKIRVSPVRPATPSTSPHPMRSHARFSTLNHFLLKRHALCVSLDSLQPVEHIRGTRRCLGDTFLTLFVASTPFPSPIFAVSPCNRPARSISPIWVPIPSVQRATTHTHPLGSRCHPPILLPFYASIHTHSPRCPSYLLHP